MFPSWLDLISASRKKPQAARRQRRSSIHLEIHLLEERITPSSAPLEVSGNHLLNALTNQTVVLRGVNRSGGQFACVQGLGISGPGDGSIRLNRTGYLSGSQEVGSQLQYVVIPLSFSSSEWVSFFPKYLRHNKFGRPKGNGKWFPTPVSLTFPILPVFRRGGDWAISSCTPPFQS